MGLYAGTGKATPLYEAKQIYVFLSEAVANGQSSVAVSFPRKIGGTAYSLSASVQIQFSADPGAYQVDIQTSDTDADGNYVTLYSLNGGLNSNFCTRQEMPLFWAKFLRVQLVSKTNPVNLTALVTR